MTFPARLIKTLPLLGAAALALLLSPGQAQTSLADQPVFSSLSVPGNVALALSVEFPTAISVAHTNNTYSSARSYLGYFDPGKCYRYRHHATDDQQRYFEPASLTTTRTCSGQWSGNFLNWATMQTIDPFRWALTGGYRSTDLPSLTILEKAYGANLGGDNNFPNRELNDATTIGAATPFNWNRFGMRIRTLGNKMQFTRNGAVGTGVATTMYDPSVAMDNNTVYQVSIRVRVCDPTNGVTWLEANCVQYSNGNYKPTGLIQQYADRITFSAFGYLANSDFSGANQRRDGAVLRARQSFVGPTKPVPGGLPVSNAAAEWNASTGVMIQNPAPADVTATNTAFAPSVPVDTSGVMNYLNKFGLSSQTYKTYDPVSELHYAALRYYRNLGNVPEWSSMPTANAATRTVWLDNAPVITSWDDPIKYSCQKNFILGIGDVNTNQDFNVPGGSGSNEPTMPGLVSADPMNPNARGWTDRVGSLHGLGNSLGTTSRGSGSFLMAGLAYYANTNDLRSDITGKQTVQTYWLDIWEYQQYISNNQFYLAAKYGGFNVPDNFDPATRATDILPEWWRTNTDLVDGRADQPRPDNYFTANQPDKMVAGLTKSFASIASKLKSFTTSFSTSLPQVAAAGVASYATQFDAKLWTGELVASKAEFDASTNQPSLTETWRFSAKLETQATGSGWDTGRRILSYRTDTRVGVPFRSGSLASAQLGTLNTGYRSGDDSADYLNYLRGERKNEQSSSVTGSAKAYRDRPNLVGDIVNAKARAVGAPSAPYSDAANPGYSAFRTAYAARKTVVYVGTNQGMLHAVDGSLTGDGGKELFAYVPGALYTGPTNTPATNGLQSIGNPEYVHYNFVDATPVVADVDFARTEGGSGSTDWRTILVGGLGKGGKSIYALDVTNPNSIDLTTASTTTEPALAGRVLWEFSDSDLGYSYGEPAVVKTRKYGWVVIFGSGHNNGNGRGYLFIVNPRTGALIKKLGTGVGSASSQAGMAHVQAVLLDVADGTADTVYAGDLLGNLWRFDVSTAGWDDSTPSPANPVKLAELTDSLGNPLPVTARPLVVVQPGTNRRYVTVGTGRLLAESDISSSQAQRFFAILDGRGARFNRAADLPSGISFPIQRSNLKPLTDLSKKITLDLKTQIGWYVDLGTLGSGPGWRVISDSTSFYGIVSFAAMAPSSSNACEPSGAGRVYAIDLGSGQSQLDGNASYAATEAGVVTDLRFYSVGGVPRLLVGTDTGRTSSPGVKTGAAPGVRRLNWREVPLAQ